MQVRYYFVVPGFEERDPLVSTALYVSTPEQLHSISIQDSWKHIVGFNIEAWDERTKTRVIICYLPKKEALIEAKRLRRLEHRRYSW